MLVPRTWALAAVCLAAATTAAHADAPITLTLSPTHPTTTDVVRLRAHFAAGWCWDDGGQPWNPTTVEGRTIHISRETSAIATTPNCTAPEDFETTLPALVAGSWSIDFRFGSATASLAFDVTAVTTELFLLDGRFGATAEWRDRQGHAHSASAVALGDAAGAFWFFDSSNLELTVKVLDGRTLNSKVWVFLASMTDVAYTVTVVDRHLVCITTPCPNARVYEGIAGHNQNVLDTGAFFATSPVQ